MKCINLAQNLQAGRGFKSVALKTVTWKFTRWNQDFPYFICGKQKAERLRKTHLKRKRIFWLYFRRALRSLLLFSVFHSPREKIKEHFSSHLMLSNDVDFIIFITHLHLTGFEVLFLRFLEEERSKKITINSKFILIGFFPGKFSIRKWYGVEPENWMNFMITKRRHQWVFVSLKTLQRN